MIIIYQYNTMDELIFKYQTMEITNKYLIFCLLMKIICYRNNLSGIYAHNLWNHVIYILFCPSFSDRVYAAAIARGAVNHWLYFLNGMRRSYDMPYICF